MRTVHVWALLCASLGLTTVHVTGQVSAGQIRVLSPGVVPRELVAWIDVATAVSARSTEPDSAFAFVRDITRPEAARVWRAKGLNRF
jgi:hypothetical protein